MRLVLSCLLIVSVFLPAVAAAQETKPTATQVPNFVKMFRSETFRESQKRAGKSAMKSFWSGNGSNLMAVQLLEKKDVRDAWGVTDEQHAQVKGAMTGMFTRPEFAETMKEMGELQKGGKLFDADGDKDAQKRFGELQTQMLEKMMELVPAEIDKVLSPEQKRKMQEFQLASMSEIPIVTPTMFEALDLSADQKTKMEAVRKELEPRFEHMADEFIDTQMKMSDKIWDAMEKDPQGFGDLTKFGERVKEMTKRLNAEDEEFRKLNEQLETDGKLFVTQLKFKMFDILTDEQLARLDEIVSNPPEYVRDHLESLRERFGRSDRPDASKAFLDAWKPGQPIPEEYRQKRKASGFPRKEN